MSRRRRRFWALTLFAFAFLVGKSESSGEHRLGLFLNFEAGNSFWHSTVVAAIMGAKHCNERDGSIVPALGRESMSQCEGLNFSFSVHNTEGSASKAVSDFLLVGEEIDVVVGAGFSSVSIPLSTVANVKKVPSISYASTSPQLNDRLSGSSMFTRTVPSDAETAQVLCILFQKFNVDNVGLIFIDDGYGLGYRDALTATCSIMDIAVHAASFESSKSQSIEYALDYIEDRKLNIIVIVAFDDDLGVIMSNAMARGLAGPGRLLVFSDGITSTGVEAFLEDSSKGDISAREEAIQYSLHIQPDGVNPSQEYQRFLDAWLTRFPARLDEINRLMPAPEFYVNTSFFTDSASTFAFAFAPFAYDASVAACRAVCQSMEGRQQNLDQAVPGSSNGTRIYDAIISDQFLGSSGRVDIESSTGTRALSTAVYAVSRLAGIRNGEGKVRVSFDKVGSWDGSKWNTKSGFPSVPPSVSFTTNENFLSAELKIVSVCLSLVLIGCCVFLIFYTWQKRMTRIISRAQPTMLIVFLLGIITSTSSTFFIGMEDLATDQLSESFLDFSCMAFFWLWSLGTAVAFAALVAKLYRIWRIFSNSALRRIKITNKDLYLFISVICSVDVIVLTVWSIVSPMKYRRIILETDVFGNPTESYGECISEHSIVFITILLSYQIMLFVAGVIFSYMVRKADSDYQESRWIIISLVSQCQMFLLGIPLIFVFGPENSASRFLVMFFVIWLNNLILVAVLYVPKIRAVAKNLKHAASASASNNSFTTHFQTKGGSPTTSLRQEAAKTALMDANLLLQESAPSSSMKRLNSSPRSSMLDLFLLRRSASSRLLLNNREASTQWSQADAERAALLFDDRRSDSAGSASLSSSSSSPATCAGEPRQERLIELQTDLPNQHHVHFALPQQQHPQHPQHSLHMSSPKGFGGLDDIDERQPIGGTSLQEVDEEEEGEEMTPGSKNTTTPVHSVSLIID